MSRQEDIARLQGIANDSGNTLTIDKDGTVIVWSFRAWNQHIYFSPDGGEWKYTNSDMGYVELRNKFPSVRGEIILPE